MLKEKPLQVAPGVAQAASIHVRSLLERLRLIDKQRLGCDKQLALVLDEIDNAEQADVGTARPSDIKIIRSFTGVGPTVAAILLSEAAQPIANRDYQALRMYSGVAPVTRATGKRSGHKASISMRRGCSHRLRWAMHLWAQNSAFNDPRSSAHYQELRERGHGYSRALRGIGDRLLKVLVAALRSGQLYDPDRAGRTVDRVNAKVGVTAR